MKHFCKSCDWWNPEMKAQVAAGAGKMGLCCFNPPRVQFFQVPVQSIAMKQPQMSMQMQPYFPATNENEFCAQHSQILRDREIRETLYHGDLLRASRIDESRNE